MRRRSRSASCALLAAAWLLLPSAATAETFFTANLSGAEEVPAVATAGTGFGRVTLNESETQITVSVYFQNLGSNVLAAHVHGSAAPGVNAPILFDLNPTTGVASGSVVARMFAVTPAQVADLKAGLLYLNIHSVNFGAGEIRGQLRVDAPFVATLAARQEVPANASNATGRGWVSLSADGMTGLATLRWSGLTGGVAIAAHIHHQRSGMNGPVICNFSPPAATTGEVVDALCAFTPTQTAALKAKGLYFNVHTGAFADGEIRGQIKRSFNPCDFDGDGKSDYTIVRNNGTTLDWWVRSSATGAVLQYSWGSASDGGALLSCPDVDGDGRADPTVWRQGANATFWSLLSTGGVQTQVWGTSGDDPRMIGDYDGDGRDDYTVVRESLGNPTSWWIRESSTGAMRLETWGIQTDFPVSGPDVDGDGMADLVVQRSGGVIWRKRSTGGVDYQYWGNGNEIITGSDFDGDGRTDVALIRLGSSHFVWWILSSLTNAAAVPYGAGYFFGSTAAVGALPTSADFDGDGRADVAVWKAEPGGAGFWWVQNSSGSLTAFAWGVSSDLPLQRNYWK